MTSPQLLTLQNLRKKTCWATSGNAFVGDGFGRDFLTNASAVLSVGNGSSDLQRNGKSTVVRKHANITDFTSPEK